jgi:hypothetical protein
MLREFGGRTCRAAVLSAVIVVALAFGGQLSAAEPFVLETYLDSGKISEGIAAADVALKSEPDAANVRFAQGILQFLQGIERLSQGLYRLGPSRHASQLPFLRLPVAPNTEPEIATYEGLRKLFLQLQADLETVEKTLSLVKGDVKVPVRIGTVLLDLNGDGKADEDERFWKIYARMNMQAEEATEEIAREYVIAFDTADAIWLRGYCHLLLALDEFILAHNWKETFDRTAHLFFARVDTKYSKLFDDDEHDDQFMEPILDLIAFIHLIRFPAEEPARMKSALAHIEQMLDLSGQMFEAVLAETDDDREWIPNPKQTGVIPGVAVTEEMLEGWEEFLVEAKSLFAGKKLIPHWRIRTGEGINLRKVFEEPTPFDLILWIQGTAAVPYLEKGEMTDLETWTRLDRIFRGEFIGFALWFN